MTRFSIWSSKPENRGYAAAVALSLMLVALWSLTHHYLGLTRDGQIYAFQAYSRIHPGLATDIYLRNNSQDGFTVFSPLYAAAIRIFGLNFAGKLLFGICATWFLVAAWFFARAVLNRDLAWLSVALLILTVGQYGSYNIFHFSEDYLTARSLGEALVVTALACHYAGHRILAFVVSALALVVHPLMAFPGFLMLLSASTSLRWNFLGALGGIGAALAISVVATLAHMATGPFGVLDPVWLEVVRERSQFLFLQFWHLRDWDVNARPFLTVALAGLVFRDEPRVRNLCLGAALIGASGFAVAGITSLIGPVAILLQGQGWRWVWIASLVGVILLPATVLRMWRDPRCGSFAAILAVLAWTFSSIDGTLAMAAALAFWLMRPVISPSLQRLGRWASIAAMAVLFWWTCKNTILYATWRFDFKSAPLWMQHFHNILQLKIPAMLLVLLVWNGIRRAASLWLPVTLTVCFASALAFALPVALQPTHSAAVYTRSRGAFTDWRRAIPHTASVYLNDGSDSPIFAWFTLRRPSYLSIDQSAGVVFSRATALEIRRRAQVLRPLMFPDYQILAKRARARHRRPTKAKGTKKPVWPTPLTRSILTSICKDPALGFVIAHQKLGFGAIAHTGPGPWHNWYLYDCGRVRARTPLA